MQITDKLLRPLTEVKYLNADNVDRYRCIMRIFFENYEKLHYWMYQEEVYAQMKEDPYFAEYRPEQCLQDLTTLTEWKNLNTIQDTRKVASIEEFKNRKYRYQMSEYSVEIERLVVRLENLFIEGASLEPTLLERIRLSIQRFPEMAELDEISVYTWWNDLNNDFVRLNQNYQDYMRDLNSVKAEEMMHTKEFLVFKDRLVEYLRNFIKGLQRNVGVIEEDLRMLDEEIRLRVFEKVVNYELSIPRMDVEVSRSMLEDKTNGRYASIYAWFVAENGQENEAGKLFDTTNEIIRRITRYAAQLSEKNALGANRREEYRKVAEMFLKCENIKEAHKLSAMVFGLERPFHLQGELIRETDSMNQEVYEEKPMDLTLKHIMGYTKPEDFGESEWYEMDEEKGIIRRHRVYKRLLFAPGMFRDDGGEEDFANLTLTPLMTSKMCRKDVIKEAIQIVKQEKQLTAEKTMAMLYTLADKFLSAGELNEIKEVLAMTRLGQMLYDDGVKKGMERGIERGREEEARQNAALTARLLKENRLDDLKRSTEDKEFKEQLLKEFGIE